jgi:flagellar basal body-associated protein FliL
MNVGPKKKKITFNLIDVALIIIALVAISVLVFVFNNKNIVKPSGSEEAQIEYTVTFSPVREEYMNLIKVGDKVINTATMENCGEVISVTNSDYYYIGVNSETGESVSTQYPGMKTIVVKIRASATKTGYGYSIDGFDVVIGEGVSIRVPDFTGNGTITSVTELGK